MAAREQVMAGANRQDRVWDGVNPVDRTMVAGREEVSAGMPVMVVVMATSNAGNGRVSPSTQVTIRWRRRNSVLNESNVSRSRWPKDQKQPPNVRSQSRASRK